MATSYSNPNYFPKYDGKKKQLLEHVLDIVDDVLLMDYRNIARFFSD